MRPHPHRAALSAVRRRHHSHRRRQGVRGADDDARQPAVRIAPAWHDDPVYIEAVASSLEAELKKLSFKPEVILASFHGVPKDYVTKGDPYAAQCAETVRLLRARLGLDETKFMLTFQ